MRSEPPPGFGPRWGEMSMPASVSAPGAPPEPPADPPSRRLLQAAAVLSVLLLLVIANAWFHSTGNPLNPIAEAAEKTQRSSGARVQMEVIYSSDTGTAPVVSTGEGEYNAESGRSRATLTVPSPTLGSVQIESVGDERNIYVRSSAFAGQLPAGREWLGIEPLLSQSEEDSLVGADGAQGEVAMLQAVSGDVESLGREKVRGIPTRRYRGTIDLGRFASLLRAEGKDESAEEYEKLGGLMPTPIEVEVWVDSSGAIRQERIVMTMPSSDGRPAVTMDMRIDLVKLGVKPAIELPDQDKVFNLTPLMKEQLQSLSS
jgi:hypothetical protein